MKALLAHFFWGIFLLLGSIVLGDSQDKKVNTLYNPLGKRDPFKILSSIKGGRTVSAIYPTEKYNLNQLSLKAILRFGGKSRAMIEAPDGQSFIIYEGETIGRERATLSRILKTEIIFTQQTFNYLGTSSLSELVLSLPIEEDKELEEEKNEQGKGTKVAPTKRAQKNNKNSPNADLAQGTDGTNIKNAVQKVLDRPNELEAQFDDIIGKGTK